MACGLWNVVSVGHSLCFLRCSPLSKYQDSLWKMNARLEQMEAGPFPVHEGQPDCSYYIRTGQCRFGAACHFNHPANRALAIAPSSMKVGYPERIGQPECQYYIKTGTCKFGATCKFNHPGIAGRVALNVLGYPLRPNVIECAYYMKNGECKYGSVCIFNHPQPTNNNYSGSSCVYPPAIHSPTTAELSFPLVRPPPYIPSPLWLQTSSIHAPRVMPQGVASARGWNPYNVGALPSSEIQPIARNSLNNGTLHSEAIYLGGAQYRSASLPPNYCVFQRKDVFPERPGQPECQFYLKTGDCKFGGVCKFHHPKERRAPVPNCVLSPKGFPLRPGERLCVFYSRFGSCKFGPSCKFDHPVEVSVSSAPTEIPAVDRVSASSSETVALSSSQDGLVEEGSTSNRKQLSLAEATQKPKGDDTIGLE